MNEEMRQAWLEISQMLGEPTREELDVFMRTWQRAVQATRRTLAEQPAQQEPVAYIRLSKTGHVMACAKTGDFYKLPDKTLLYTSPPAQRKPLTDEQQIAEALRRHGLTLVKTATGYDVLKLGQIAAHGIKENT